jgi:chromosome segregation ATPase
MCLRFAAQRRGDAEAGAVLGLEEALAVPELVDALTSFREVVDFIREIPRNRVELETTIKRIEQEKVCFSQGSVLFDVTCDAASFRQSRLQKELSTTETRCEERVLRLREELQSLQGQVSDYRKVESSRSAGTKQTTSLEQMLKQERDDKEKALALVTKLKDECDLLTRDLHSAKRDLATQRAQSVQVGSTVPTTTHIRVLTFNKCVFWA